NCPTLEILKPEMELQLEKFRYLSNLFYYLLLIKIKIRKQLMKKVKLILAIQRLKKCLTLLAKINLPMIMKMKRDQPKTNRYITIQILILNRMIACLISGNYFDLFYF